MNFWKQLPNKSKTELTLLLTKKLGQPDNELNQNLLTEIIKKINSYYSEPEERNYTIHSLLGLVQEIKQKKFKEGKRLGQIYYVLKLAGKETLQALQENLDEHKWNQITKLALLGQNLVFTYRHFYTNKQIINFVPHGPEK